MCERTRPLIRICWKICFLISQLTSACCCSVMTVWTASQKKSFLSMHLLFLCAYRVENLRAQRLSPEVWQTVQNGASSIQHINIVSMLADIGLAFSAGIDVVSQFYFDSGCMSSPKTCVCRLIHAVLPRFQWSNSETNIVPPSNYFTVCNFLT